MPKIDAPGFNFPYVEGLTIEEAMNDLAFMSVGIYQEPLYPQQGAPIRLTVPWKYGFKSIKSIVKIEFIAERPKTYWNEANGNGEGLLRHWPRDLATSAAALSVFFWVEGGGCGVWGVGVQPAAPSQPDGRRARDCRVRVLRQRQPGGETPAVVSGQRAPDHKQRLLPQLRLPRADQAVQRL
mmetsp:Transcript_26982/g.86705  ORF Transcript_26982/g.86705 Transcript_26982/m.86705 type:complete len:182 (-) Transcript_26982:149-694(-)